MAEQIEGCACRWIGSTVVTRCAIHAGWFEVIAEWAERAKTAEAKLSASPVPQVASPSTMTQFEWTLPERFTSACWLTAEATKESLAAYHAGVDAETHVDFLFRLDGELFEVSFDELVAALRAPKG